MRLTTCVAALGSTFGWSHARQHARVAADLANILLTMTSETWGRAWAPRRAKTSSGLVRRPAVDRLGHANPAESGSSDTVQGAATPAATKTPVTVRESRASTVDQRDDPYRPAWTEFA